MINGVKFGQSDVRIHFMMNPSPEYKEVKAILKDVAELQKRAEKRLSRIAKEHEKAMARMEKSKNFVAG